MLTGSLTTPEEKLNVLAPILMQTQPTAVKFEKNGPLG
jgi:hypothetical protein